MKFKGDDTLLSMSRVPDGLEIDVFVVFENGLAKRTHVSEYRIQGRGGYGIQVARLSAKGGDLVGALTVTPNDEVMVVMEKGKIVRSRVDEVRHTSRSTQGVKFATPDPGDSIVAVARNAESVTEEELEEVGDLEGTAPTAPITTVPSTDGVPSDKSEQATTPSSDGDSGGDE